MPTQDDFEEDGNEPVGSLSNKTIAAQLKEAARLLDVLDEDAFRARAYAGAARVVESTQEDVGALIAAGRVTTLRGVGQGLARDLAGLAEHGELPLLAELRARVPPSVRELFRVSGLGGKKVGALWRSGVSDLDDLIAAAEDGRLERLKGFGKKSAEGILAAARFAASAKTRMRLDVAHALADAVTAYLADGLPDAEVHVSGSFRRRLETVRDLNLIVTGTDTGALERALAPVAAITEATERSLSTAWHGLALQFTVVAARDLGAALLYGTGNHDYRAQVLATAAARSLTLHPWGLLDGDAPLPTPTEAEAYAALGLPAVPPELRERADATPVPHLLTLEDVGGLVHNHSTASDGTASLREMVAATRQLGFSYYGSGDHSRSSFVANGLSVERLMRQAEEVAALRAYLLTEGSDFGVLHGAEVDILADGSLDYPDEVLETLDYTVVSVHQNFQLSEAEQTARLIRAVEHPRASILGHMTGRLLLRRPPYAVDALAVIEACARTGTVLEINASPYRLDLDWRLVREAKARGCRFAINPDAHSPDGLADIGYGVWMARKAGLTAADVTNTAKSADDFLARLA